MKKILFALSVFTVTGFIKLQAQQAIVNNDFTNWALDTFYLPADTIGTLPADTVSFLEPVGWTTSNFLTDLDSFGHKTLVTQSTNTYGGLQYSIQLVTDSVLVPPGLISSLDLTSITIPGFALSGVFPLSASTFSNATKTGGVINPSSIPGAGQPFSKRLATINGYYDYIPEYNTNTHANDTCVIWAALRSGSTLVANAIFKSTDTTGGYQPFSANFQYVSCAIPDTLVLFLSSSAPDIYTFIQFEDGLQTGSELWVDSLYYDTLAADYNFAPFVSNYIFTVYENQTDTLNVAASDSDCSDSALTFSLVSGPFHGSASIYNNNIVYTPTTGYLGFDTMYYAATNIYGDSSVALCQVYVTQNTGINQLVQSTLSIYPVPSGTELNIQFQNPGRSQAMVYDMTGRLVLTAALDKNINPLNVESLANGLYSLQITNAQNSVIARGKFAVVR